MKSLFPLICSDDVAASSAFYRDLLDLQPVFEADWYVQLQSKHDPVIEIAFVQRDHASVPEGYRDLPKGVIVTLDTDDVDAIYARAQRLGVTIVLELRDEEWGQRHFMARDHTGLLLDVVELIPPSAEFAESYVDVPGSS